jgi:hypothetical protein
VAVRRIEGGLPKRPSIRLSGRNSATSAACKVRSSLRPLAPGMTPMQHPSVRIILLNRALLRNRTVDLLLTIHNSAGSLPGGGVAGQQHPTGRLRLRLAMGPEMCGCETLHPFGERPQDGDSPEADVWNGRGAHYRVASAEAGPAP